MKILKIFGVVVAVHAVGFMFVFAIPGCRSTSRQVSPSLATETTNKPSAEPAPVDRPAPAPASVSTSPSPSVNSTDLNPGVPSTSASTAGVGDTGIRFNRANPTRPGTPVATALETPPVNDVTPAKTYVITKGDTLSGIAKKNGISTKELLAANNLKKDAVLVAGKKLIIPSKSASTAAAPAPTGGATPAAPSSSAETMTYEVKTGDTLDKIAKRTGGTVAAIKNLNKLTSDKVHVGQKLIVPAGSSAATTLAHEPDATANAAPAAAVAAATPPPGGTTYTVKANEPLATIAKKFGVRLSDIAADNNISDPKKIRVGQTLIIRAPNKSKGSTASATPATGAATPAPAPTSPVSPAPANPTAEAAPSSPISAPSADAPPPVIKVEDPSSTPPAKN